MKKAGRPSLDASETLRIQLKISAEQFAALDDWRFANRIGSLSEAVRRLVRLGLAAHAAATQEKGPAEGATSPSHGSQQSTSGEKL